MSIDNLKVQKMNTAEMNNVKGGALSFVERIKYKQVSFLKVGIVWP